MAIDFTKTQIVIRWEGDAYRAYSRDLGAPLGGKRVALDRTLGYWMSFVEYDVVDVESFATDEDRQMWAEQVAVKAIGQWLASPGRPRGDVYSGARHMLSTLRRAGVKVDLDRE